MTRQIIDIKMNRAKEDGSAMPSGMEYGRTSDNCIDVSDNIVTAYIKKPGQGYPITFMLNPSYWESWSGPELCVAHKWIIQTLSLKQTCPILPCNITDGDGSLLQYFYHTIDIVDGKLILTSNGPYDDNRSTNIYFWWESSESDPAILNATKMIIKVSASYVSEPDDPTRWENIHLYIKTATGSRAELIIATGNNYDPGSWSAAPIIGDNGGEEMTIDLAEYGIAGDIVHVEISLDVEKAEYSASCIVDYIDFAS